MKRIIIYGLPVYTMDNELSVQEALVFVNERIDFIGEIDEAIKRYPGAEKIQLKGGCILPGFIDAHIYLRDFALVIRQIDFSGIRDVNTVIDLIKEEASVKIEGEWIVCGGLDRNLFNYLTAEKLDMVTEKNPVVIYSEDMLCAVCNSIALNLAGIDEKRKDPMGGKIEREHGLKPNGILRERAVDLIKNCIPEESPEELEVSIERALKVLLSRGITSFCEFGTEKKSLLNQMLLKLSLTEKLSNRVVTIYPDRDAYTLGEMGISSYFGGEYLKFGGAGINIDGTLRTQTAYMGGPYRGKLNEGILLTDEDEIYSLLKGLYSSNIWAALTCYGNMANKIAIKVWEKLIREKDMPQHLRRIDRATALSEEDIQMFSRLEIKAVVNPANIPVDREKAIRLLGHNAGLLYRLRSLLDAGVSLAFGSEAPNAPVNPLFGIYCAVERKGFFDGPELRFFPRERITLEEAVYAHTIGGARACGIDKETGSLESGKFADFIHLSRDIFKEGPEKLKDTEVLLTVVGGKVVFRKDFEDKTLNIY